MAKASKKALEQKFQKPNRPAVTSSRNLLPNYGRAADEVNLTFRVPAEFRDRLKMLAAEERSSMKDLMVEAVEEVFKARGIR